MEIDAKSRDGNAFVIMAAVNAYLRQTDRLSEWADIQKGMTAGNYENLCNIAEKVSLGTIKIVNRDEEWN